MSTGKETKSISVRMDSEIVDKLDKTLIKMKAAGDVPMDFTRSDLIREVLIDAEKNPEIIEDYAKE